MDKTGEGRGGIYMYNLELFCKEYLCFLPHLFICQPFILISIGSHVVLPSDLWGIGSRTSQGH